MERKGDQEVWTHIIEVFKDLPYMWNKNHKYYFNREMKQQGFEKMYHIFCELEEDVDFHQFKKKFENMRTSFARELKKVNALKKIASDQNDVYKPSLWYYSQFTFLDDNNDSSCGGVDPLNCLDEISHNSESDDQYSNSAKSSELNQSIHYQTQSTRKYKTEQEEEISPSKKYRMAQKKQNKEQLFNTQQLPATTLTTDDWEVIGKGIGLQLKGLTKHQQIIVQKLISDAIYYGKLQKLTEESTITLGDKFAQYETT